MALAIAVSAQPALADSSRAIDERRLSNGLRVIVCPDPTASDVTLLVRYGAGSRDEPTSLEGVAHLVEHAMFLGSKHVPRGKLAELLEQAGATQVNGATSIDDMRLFETLPPERLELGLWLESDRMGYLLHTLGEITLRRARNEVLNELRHRTIETPLGSVSRLLHAELFPAWHPYHHLPIGTADALRLDIRWLDARAFAATWFGPGNATVVIAGKVDPAHAMRLVEKYFGTLAARTPPPRPALPRVKRAASTIVTVAAAVVYDDVRVAWPTPAWDTPGDAALDVAAAILVGGGAGWLHRALAMGPRKRVLRISARQQSWALTSIFEIRADVAKGRAPDEVLAVLHETLARLTREIGEADVARAKRILRNERLAFLDSSLGWASAIAWASTRGPMPPRFDGNLGRHDRVTLEEVRSAVRTHLAGRPSVAVISRSTPRAPLAGKPIDRKEVAP